MQRKIIKLVKKYVKPTTNFHCSALMPGDQLVVGGGRGGGGGPFGALKVFFGIGS